MASQVVTEKTKKFLKLYGSQIASAISDSGLFFPSVVGQKCNESGYGTSDLAKLYNNFGGIKGRPKEAIGTTPKGWAIFRTPEDCFRSYARFITTLPQYSKALKSSSPEEQIKELVKAGYCEINKNKKSRGYMPSPEYYLNICQGAIDVTRDTIRTGRVSRTNLLSTISTIKTNTI